MHIRAVIAFKTCRCQRQVVGCRPWTSQALVVMSTMLVALRPGLTLSTTSLLNLSRLNTLQVHGTARLRAGRRRQFYFAQIAIDAESETR